MSTNDEMMPVRPVERAFSLDDIHVRTDGGDGRVVEAYAAVFNTSTEVMDQDGHYNEVIEPGAFTRTLQHKGTSFGVLFNHGRTIDGQPNPAASLPIGVPLQVRSDERGLWTETRYLDNPLADHVLDAIKQGAIRAQSFSGRFRISARSWPDGHSARALARIARREIEMREYGPAVFAAYDGAAILGTRSALLEIPGFTPSRKAQIFARSLMSLPPEEVASWLAARFEITTPEGDSESLPAGTPEATGPAGTPDTDAGNHSERAQEIRERISAFRASHPPKE